MIVADTHLHLYPHYDLAVGVRECVARMNRLVPDAVCAGYLAERSDCRVYEALRTGRSGVFADDVTVEKLSDGRVLAIRAFGSEPLYLAPGRQIVTKERVELLGLTTDANIPDGLPAETTIQRIREVGGIPVLAWAVGKWLFGRAGTVRSLLDRFGPDELLLGDSAMRPTIWPTPVLIRTARNRGYKVVAGTDPLPAHGEEHVMGRYATVMDLEFNDAHAIEDLRSALRLNLRDIRCVGKRSGPVTFLRRYLRN